MSKAKCKVPVAPIVFGSLAIVGTIAFLVFGRRKTAGVASQLEGAAGEGAKNIHVGEPEYNTLEDVTSPPSEEEPEASCD